MKILLLTRASDCDNPIIARVELESFYRLKLLVPLFNYPQFSAKLVSYVLSQIASLPTLDDAVTVLNYERILEKAKQLGEVGKLNQIMEQLSLTKDSCLVRRGDFLLEYAKALGCFALINDEEIGRLDLKYSECVKILVEDELSVVVTKHISFVSGYFDSFTPFTIDTAWLSSILQEFINYLEVTVADTDPLLTETEASVISEGGKLISF